MVHLISKGLVLQFLMIGQALCSPVITTTAKSTTSTAKSSTSTVKSSTSTIKSSTSTVKTTSTKASTTCSQVIKSPLPTNYYCDVQGRLRKPEAIINTFPNPDDGSASCLDHCLDMTHCHGFSIDLAGHVCSLYNTSIESQNWMASETNQYFWNRKCFSESCAKVNTSTIVSSTSNSSTITKGPSTSSASKSSSSSSTASLPLTTIDPPGPVACVVPLPLAVRDCQTIQEEISGAVVNYKLYYNGTGVVENSNNAGNQNSDLPPFSTILEGVLDGCEASTQCAGAAVSFGKASVYHSFDIHYLLSECAWECVLYGGYNNLTSAFNVKDKDAFRTHGFTGKMKLHG